MFDTFLRGFLMDAAGDSGGGGGVAVAEPSSDFGGDSGGTGGTEARSMTPSLLSLPMVHRHQNRSLRSPEPQ